MIRFERFGSDLGACWLCVGLFCMSFSCIFCREVLPSILYVCRGGFMIRLDRFGSHVGACLLRVGFIFREFCNIFQILILCAFFIVCRPRLIWWLVFPTCPQSYDWYMYVVVSVSISILMDLCHWLRCRSVVRQLCITFASIDSVCFVIDFLMESDLVFVDFQYIFRPHGVAFQDNANSHETSFSFVSLDRILYAARSIFP